MISSRIWGDVQRERNRQDVKHPNNVDNGPVDWVAIATEELGEVSEEALGLRFFNPNYFSSEETAEIFRNGRRERYRTELIHLAAVAIAAIEQVDEQERQRATEIMG